MAITAPTKTSDFNAKFLPPAMSAPIFEEAAKISVVQQLARKVELGYNGKDIPVVTGKLSAGWVAEGAQKPASQGSIGLKNISPKKLATIAVVSAEVVRANPGGYMDMIRPQIAEAFALAFDAATLHGTNTPFGTYIDQTTKSQEIGANGASAGGVHADLNAALAKLVADRKKLTGWALDDVFEPVLNGAVDTTGRPLYIEAPTLEDTAAQATRAGRLLGRRSFMADGVATTDQLSVIGYGGNWSQAAWGVVGGISYSVSTEATVTIDGNLVSLWEHNLVGILAEAEYGWLVNDVDSFVKLTNTNNTPITSA